MRKVLCIIGAGLIAAVSAAAVYLANTEKKAQKAQADCKKPEETTADEPLTESKASQEETICAEVKNAAVHNMNLRHTDAAEAMRESINTIRENVSPSEDTDSEIDEISAELDEMLRED